MYNVISIKRLHFSYISSSNFLWTTMDDDDDSVNGGGHDGVVSNN